MSLKTWKEKFYPVPARLVEEVDAVQHSLLKWEGLTPENLAEHELSANTDGRGGYITDGNDRMYMDTENCALCQLHYPKSKLHCNHETCPLGKYLQAPCYKSGQPYNMWVFLLKPKNMIQALTALKTLDNYL